LPQRGDSLSVQPCIAHRGFFPCGWAGEWRKFSRNKNWPAHVAAFHIQREAFMTRKSLYSGVAAIAIAAILAAAPVPTGD